MECKACQPVSPSDDVNHNVITKMSPSQILEISQNSSKMHGFKRSVGKYKYTINVKTRHKIKIGTTQACYDMARGPICIKYENIHNF